MKAIETARLKIRRIVPSDVDAMFAVYGDAESMRYVGDGQPLTFERCEQWVRVTEKNYAARGYGMFALEERATGEVVGFAGLVHPGGQAASSTIVPGGAASSFTIWARQCWST